MPISTAEKTALQSTADTLATQVAALVVDTVDVAALQAQILSLTLDRDNALAHVADLQAKIAKAIADLA